MKVKQRADIEAPSRANCLLFIREFYPWFLECFTEADVSDATLRLVVRDVERHIGIGWKYALGHPKQELLSDDVVGEAE